VIVAAHVAAMQGVEDALSYHHAVAATRGVESASNPPSHHRRDSIVRDVPTPSTRRVPRAGVSASIPPVGVDASTGRARREEDVVVEDSVLSGLRRRTSQQSLRRDLQSARLPLRMQHRRRRSACVDGAPPAPRPGRHRHGALSVIFLYALLAAGGARGDELREITCYRQDREGSTLSGAR